MKTTACAPDLKFAVATIVAQEAANVSCDVVTITRRGISFQQSRSAVQVKI